MESYCLKCRSKQEMVSPKTKTLKGKKKGGKTRKSRKMMVGKCAECGTKMVRFI